MAILWLYTYNARWEFPMYFIGHDPRARLQAKTILMFLKTLRGFRKLFMDHITKRSRKGVEDKMGCEHNAMCVSMCMCVYC